LKAIIIENEESAARGMARLLETFCPDVEIIGIANDGFEGIELVNNLRPNIIFLDIEMPRINGFQVLNKLHDRSVNVVITTAHDNYAIQAIKHQAIDYLLKPIDPVELMSVINKVQVLIGRNEYIKDMELKFSNYSDEELEMNIDYELTRQYDLSKREIEILKLSLKVKSAKEISDQLFLSIYTVNKHLQNIYKKMNVNSRFELEKKIKG